jgi:hypothetical protein
MPGAGVIINPDGAKVEVADPPLVGCCSFKVSNGEAVVAYRKSLYISPGCFELSAFSFELPNVLSIS